MRRVAATTLTVGTVIAAMAATAAPAEAATKWTSPAWSKYIVASGTHARANGKVAIKFTLKDLRRNGQLACVRFELTNKDRTNGELRKFWFSTEPQAGKTLSRSKSFTSSFTGHLRVMECAISTKTKKATASGWKSLY